MPLEDLDKRFGVIAVEKGFITSVQLIEAMKIQIYEELEDNKRRIIGVILRDKGYITISQVDEVLKFMGLL